MTMKEVEEEVRQMKWDLRILRDQALRVADALPAADRERLAEISERITEATRELIAAVNHDDTESEAETVARLRDGMAEVQQQLKLIARELNEVADSLLPH